MSENKSTAKQSKKKNEKNIAKNMKAGEVSVKIKQIEKRFNKLEKSFQQFAKGISQDITGAYNKMDKIDAITDRHSAQLRGQTNFNNQVNQALGGLIQDVGKIKEQLGLDDDDDD